MLVGPVCATVYCALSGEGEFEFFKRTRVAPLEKDAISCAKISTVVANWMTYENT